MNDIILLKMGEIVLKGLNKKKFEQRLLSNVKRRLQAYGRFHVYAVQSTVYIEPEGDCDMDGAFEAMQKVFGVASLSRAAACEKDPDAIARRAIAYLRDDMETVASFKVESKRSDKRFPMNSIELSRYVGGLLSEAYPDVRVDVHEPELTVHLEVRDFAAYVHAAPVKGAGGMPVGSNGTAVTLLSGGIDSPVSSWMTCRRGIHLIPVHFFSFPYTSEAAKEKVVELVRLLTPWCGRLTLEVVPFTHIQEEIRDKCPEEFFTVIMRRFMMRIAEKIARYNGAAALVTGENVGQVASQTMEAMAVTEAVCTLPVLRPLVCMDKQDIIELARKIGTFDTSILPYEDCCTVFTPRHPKTKPHLAEVEAVEAALDVETLVQEAFDGIERIRVELS
ncbi:MAG: tRNA 4-thiouridine(8) synthase ThiI [Clostridiales bacterium]|nr:tRNA 4-thiouridine(8) synthase ThiI [Clostridiales bacterium]